MMSKVKGIYLMIAVAFMQTIITAIVKVISTDITTGVKILAYYVVPLLFSLPMILKSGFATYKTDKLGFFFLRGIFAALAVFCFFYAAQNIPLGIAAILFNTIPIFVPIFARIFLNERSSRNVYIGILVSLCGVIITISPHYQDIQLQHMIFGLCVALASGMLMAMAIVMLQVLAKNNEPTDKIVFYLYLMCSIVSLLAIAVEAMTTSHTGSFVHIDQKNMFFVFTMLFALGAVSYISQRVMTNAFKYMPAAKLAPFFYISVPFASVVDWAIWKQTLTMNALIGFLLVVIGVLILSKKQSCPIRIVENNVLEKTGELL